MTSDVEKYMQTLRHHLRALPDDEINDIVDFYTEYLADAGITTKEEIERELGTPRQLSLNILADHSIKEEANDHKAVPKTKVKTIWLIILALLATPATLVIGLILLCFLIALFAVVFAGVIVVVSLAGGGIFLTVGSLYTGFALLFSHFATALYYLGIGLTGLGLLLVVIPLVWFCSVWIVKACARLVQFVYYRLIKKGEA